jgi:hypothetical protein
MMRCARERPHEPRPHAPHRPRTGNLHRQAQRLVCGHGAADRVALDVLQHQIVRADVIHLTDMGMVERHNRARFLVEAISVGSRELRDATMRPSRVSRAFHTSPIPPAPMAERIS